MIAEVLGTTIDIHGGGQDLIFPHHENELAQSACAHDGAPLARIWMHNGFLNMGGSDKMSKSLGNVVGIDALLAQGIDGQVLRLALLSAHYRQPLEWSSELLDQSKVILRRLHVAGPARKFDGGVPHPSVTDALSDDLNTPAAMAALQRLANSGQDVELARSLYFLGLPAPISGNAEITLDAVTLEAHGTVESFRSFADRLVAARTAARAAKNFAESDRIRDELTAAGIILEDSPGGTTWRRA